MNQNPKILYISPNKDFSGYATAARDYIAALDSVGCDIVTRSLNYDGAARKLTGREKELQSKPLKDIDIVLSHTTPIEISRRDDLFNVLYMAWETDRFPDPFAESADLADLILVPCDENIKAARRAGVSKPIIKIPHTFDVQKYKQKVTPFTLQVRPDTFRFLTILQMSKKKGLDVLLRSYFAEFGAHDNVVLILKVYAGPNDGDAEKNAILELIQKAKEGCRLTQFPPIILLHSVMEEDLIPRLYASSDCYVLPSRGEGWSITAFDALGYGVPAIATAWGGPTEFLTSTNGWPIDYTMTPCFGQQMGAQFMYTCKEKWAEPSVVDLMRAMREAYQMKKNCPEIWKEKKQAAADTVANFSYQKIGTLMRDTIYNEYRKWKNVH